MCAARVVMDVCSITKYVKQIYVVFFTCLLRFKLLASGTLVALTAALRIRLCEDHTTAAERPMGFHCYLQGFRLRFLLVSCYLKRYYMDVHTINIEAKSPGN